MELNNDILLEGLNKFFNDSDSEEKRDVPEEKPGIKVELLSEYTAYYLWHIKARKKIAAFPGDGGLEEGIGKALCKKLCSFVIKFTTQEFRKVARSNLLYCKIASEIV